MAGVSVGEIEATFRLRDELTPSLQVANRQIEQVADNLETATQRLDRLTGAQTTQAGAARDATKETDGFGMSMAQLGQAATAFSFAQGVSSALEFASKLTDLSEATGLSVADLQRINIIATETGSSLDQSAGAIQRLQKTIFEGGDKASEALKGLGIATADIAGLKPMELFTTVGEAIGRVQDPTERTARAMQLLGRGGADLLPLLQRVDELKTQVPVMSEQAVSALDTFDDRWGRVKIGTVSAIGQIVGSFGDLDSAMALLVSNPFSGQATLEHIEANKRKWLEFKEGVGIATDFIKDKLSWLVGQSRDLFSDLSGYVVDFIGDVKTWLVDRWMDHVRMTIDTGLRIAAMFLTVKNQAVTYAQQLFTGVKTWLVDQFSGIVESLRTKLSAVTGFFNNMYMAVVGGSIVPDMINGIASEFGRLGSVMVEPTGLATGGVQGLFSGLFTNISKVASDGFKDLLSRTSIFGGEFGGTWSGIASTVGGLFDNMMGKLSSFISSGKFSLDQFLLDFETFGASLSARATILMATEWFKAFIGPHYTIGGGEEDERRRREEGEQYFPTTPGYEPPSNEGTGNPYTPFASGGIVTRPTMGLVGEAGPEAIIPLKNWSGMGGGVNIYIDAGGAVFADDSSIRRFADKLLPQLSYALRREGLATA